MLEWRPAEAEMKPKSFISLRRSADATAIQECGRQMSNVTLYTTHKRENQIRFLTLALFFHSMRLKSLFFDLFQHDP